MRSLGLDGLSIFTSKVRLPINILHCMSKHLLLYWNFYPSHTQANTPKSMMTWSIRITSSCVVLTCSTVLLWWTSVVTSSIQNVSSSLLISHHWTTLLLKSFRAYSLNSALTTMVSAGIANIIVVCYTVTVISPTCPPTLFLYNRGEPEALGLFTNIMLIVVLRM